MAEDMRMKALCLAGRIILENGGETYRAEDTVRRIAASLGLCGTEVFGIPSGLFITITDENGESRTAVCRVYAGGVNLLRVDAVNHISRRLAAGELGAEGLLEALEAAALLGSGKRRLRGTPFAAVAAAVSAFGFIFLFGGGIDDAAVGAFCAALTQIVPAAFGRRRGGTVFSTIVGSLLCTLIPFLFKDLTGGGDVEAMIAGALMPLVPGLSMTNAVSDMLRGDMVSGVSHAARALMIAALVAGGALFGAHVYSLVGGAL